MNGRVVAKGRAAAPARRGGKDRVDPPQAAEAGRSLRRGSVPQPALRERGEDEVVRRRLSRRLGAIPRRGQGGRAREEAHEEHAAGGEESGRLDLDRKRCASAHGQVGPHREIPVARTRSAARGAGAASLPRTDRQRRHQGPQEHEQLPRRLARAGTRPHGDRRRTGEDPREPRMAPSRSSSSIPRAARRPPKAVVLRHSYTLTPDGSLRTENVFTIDKAVPDLPRLGVVLTLPCPASRS